MPQLNGPVLVAYCRCCREIQSHIAEPFWYIHVSYTPAAEPNEPHQQQQQQRQRSCEFKWVRGRLHDEATATVLYEACLEDPTATVMEVSECGSG